MPQKSEYRPYRDFRSVRYSKLYWLNIDVTLRDIFFRQVRKSIAIVRREQSVGLEYCVLQGMGSVANSLTVGRDGVDFDRFIVDISGFLAEEDFDPIYQLRPTAKMIWNDLNARSPRLDIYIPNTLLRRLIELYVTKRIDKVQLATQIAVVGDQSGNISGIPEAFPLLGEAEHLFFRRVQCQLLSVYTSIGKN